MLGNGVIAGAHTLFLSSNTRFLSDSRIRGILSVGIGRTNGSS